MIRCSIAVLLSVVVLWSRPLGAADADAQLEALRQQHFCEILGYLKAIRSHPPTPHDRFLVVAVAERPGYVQCLFYSRDRRILCELASGFYAAPQARFVAPGALAALAQLGYGTDAAKGNYQQSRAAKDLAGIADLLIRTLRTGYGVTPDDHFRYKAPLVPTPPPAQSYVDGHCEAVTS